jgi:hypothetical protein
MWLANWLNQPHACLKLFINDLFNESTELENRYAQASTMPNSL